MKSICLFGFLLIAVPAFSQETRLKKQNIGPTANISETEEFDVLKTDRNVRHGTYRHQLRGREVESGFFRNNQRDSLWTTFYLRDGKVKSRGYYRNDRKIGIWDYFDEKGQRLNQFDFSAGHWVGSPVAPSDNLPVRLLVGGDTLTASPEYPAMFAGGREGYSDFVLPTLVYPAELLRTGQDGRVRMGFWIDKEGRVSDIRPTGREVGPLVKEATRIVERSDWQ
ncbi:MAG: energy transducer TonB [Cytophagaceae bacterium]|nr:energy transducer TonB [Cytophagaceae bacterium]